MDGRTMKFKEYLQEEWMTSVFSIYRKKYQNDDKIDVYRNPSPKELNIIGPDVRFIIRFDKKEIICWDAGEMIHSDMVKKLEGGYSHSEYSWEDNLWGVAQVKNGKLKFDRSDQVNVSKEFENSKVIGFIEKWDGKDEWTKTFFIEPIISIIKELVI